MNYDERSKNDKAIQANNNTMKNNSVQPAKRLFHPQEEVASILGLSVRTFSDLRRKHQLYTSDGSRTTKDDPKKDSPLWSSELVELIAFARRKTPQGIRELTDDEALKVRIGMSKKKRREYLDFIED